MIKKILIVEDHEDFRTTVKGYLASQKLNVEIYDVGSGEEAVEESSRLNPDIVLMDIRLPNMNGIEAAGLIKKLCPQAEIIALTVFETQAFRETFKSKDIAVYIGKSELYEKLIPRIKNILNKKNGMERQRTEVSQ